MWKDRDLSKELKARLMVGWLVGCVRFNVPLDTSFDEIAGMGAGMGARQGP